MRAIFPNTQARGGDWQLAVAAGFIALSVLGAAADRRNAVIDRSFAESRVVMPTVAPLTSAQLVREMMTHD